MSSKRSLYALFFQESDYSLSYAELVAANSRFFAHCERRNLLSGGIFAELIELKYGLATLNVYYSNEQDEIDLGNELLMEFLHSRALPSVYKLGHLVVAEYMVDGGIHRLPHKERADLSTLITHRNIPPVVERTQFLIRSSVYDTDQLTLLKQKAARSSVFNSVRKIITDTQDMIKSRHYPFG